MNAQACGSDLKWQGASVDDAGKQVMSEFHTKYPDWQGAVYIPNEVKRVYEHAQ